MVRDALVNATQGEHRGRPISFELAMASHCEVVLLRETCLASALPALAMPSASPSSSCADDASVTSSSSACSGSSLAVAEQAAAVAAAAAAAAAFPDYDASATLGSQVHVKSHETKLGLAPLAHIAAPIDYRAATDAANATKAAAKLAATAVKGVDQSTERHERAVVQSASEASRVLADGLVLPDTAEAAAHLPSRAAARMAAAAAPRTAGRGWFDMPTAEVTPEVKQVLSVLRYRNYLDPKRFYKGAKAAQKPPKHFLLGTVQDNPWEGKAGRLTKRQRQPDMLQEYMADTRLRKYARDNVREVQAAGERRSVKAYKAKQALRERKSRRPR